MITSLDNSSKAVQILSTQSRRADLSPIQLKEIHRTLGRLLSYEYANRLDLHSIEINHVQGLKKGLDIAPHEFTLILTMMRSGIYIADGFREILGFHSRLEFIDEKTNLIEALSKYSLNNMHVVLADSVINTGETVTKVINSLPYCKSLTVICQVMHSDFAQSLLVKSQDIHFITCRISQNFYIGDGKTDTGNRLFGFIPEFSEKL